MGDAPCPVTATGCVPRDRQGAQAAGSAASPGKGPNFPERSMPIDEPRLNAFLGRALNDMGTAMSATLILRSEEHTSDPVTNAQLVCRLLLEKKNKNIIKNTP